MLNYQRVNHYKPTYLSNLSRVGECRGMVFLWEFWRNSCIWDVDCACYLMIPEASTNGSIIDNEIYWHVNSLCKQLSKEHIPIWTWFLIFLVQASRYISIVHQISSFCNQNGPWFFNHQLDPKFTQFPSTWIYLEKSMGFKGLPSCKL